MKREEEKEENEMGAVKRRREGSVSVVAFQILDSNEDLSWEDPFDVEDWSGCEPDSCACVPDVIDVPVSLSSVVTEFCDVSSMCSDREFVEPQSFSFSKMRAHCCTVTQEEMRYEDSPVKAPPPSRRRMTPPTPLQSSYSSFESSRGTKRWNIRFGGRVRKRRGVKVHLLRQMKDIGKCKWKSSVVSGAHRKEN